MRMDRSRIVKRIYDYEAKRNWDGISNWKRCGSEEEAEAENGSSAVN